jgi:hypothetical protein
MSEQDLTGGPEWKDFLKQRTVFFALIGQCVTQYQTVEDYLPDIFAAVLGIDHAKALRIFGHMRGLETKLSIITEGISDAPAERRQDWDGLLKRIRKAAEARNQIAHANPVHRGADIVVQMGADHQVVSVEQKGESRMELHKQTQNTSVTWTTEVLVAEYERTRKLFFNLIAFVKRLKGEAVPPHLDE